MILKFLIPRLTAKETGLYMHSLCYNICMLIAKEVKA